MTRTEVLYCAPGSGLGHLNRALAVCLELRALGVRARIATNSPFAEGIARLAEFPITGIATERWREDVRSYAESARPALMVCDTFPRGIRGEWEAGLPAPCVYMARRLNRAACAALLQGEWRKGVTGIIAAERLGADHEAALSESGVPVARLPGPIRLRPGMIETPVPEELERRLETGRCCLVVHGGPAGEVEKLVAAAGEAEVVAAITPWGQRAAGMETFDYYPAGNLVARAARVVSGAGYNMVADMMFARGRHTAVAFERRYDDQAGRLAAWRDASSDGTGEAAEAIAALVR